MARLSTRGPPVGEHRKRLRAQKGTTGGGTSEVNNQRNNEQAQDNNDIYAVLIKGFLIIMMDFHDGYGASVMTI